MFHFVPALRFDASGFDIHSMQCLAGMMDRQPKNKKSRLCSRLFLLCVVFKYRYFTTVGNLTPGPSPEEREGMIHL
jgi:hypothetical protein